MFISYFGIYIYQYKILIPIEIWRLNSKIILKVLDFSKVFNIYENIFFYLFQEFIIILSLCNL